MTKDPKGEQQVVDQLQQLWSNAQQQLEQLKRAVAENVEVNQLRARLESAEHGRQQALTVLGEAAQAYFDGPGSAIPAPLKSPLEAARRAESTLQQERSSIRDLLLEAEVVKKEPPKKKGGKS